MYIGKGVDESNRDFKLAEEIIGSKIEPVNDFIGFTESDERGGRFVVLHSQDMLEEDLSQMETRQTLIGSEKIAYCTNSALFATLAFFGDKVDRKKLSRLLPDIDIAEVEKYDFSKSRIKFITLAHEDFENIAEACFPDKDSTLLPWAFTFMPEKHDSNSLAKTDIKIDISNKTFVILDEVPVVVKESLEKTGPWPRDLTQQDQDYILINLEACAVHEIIHTLDVGNDLPRPFCEAVTEWYKQQILREHYTEKEIKEKTLVGYDASTEAVDILVTNLIKHGLGINDVDSAFIRGDSDSREHMLCVLKEHYGEKNADRIFNWDFKNGREALTSMLKFEHDYQRKQQEKPQDYCRFRRAKRNKQHDNNPVTSPDE